MVERNSQHAEALMELNNTVESALGVGVFIVQVNMSGNCCGFVNRCAIGVGVCRFVEGSEHGGVIQDGGSTSITSFRSRNGGETLRAAIIHYMATSARLQ
jgi:hypothetical protein